MNFKLFIRKLFSPEAWAQRWHEFIDFMGLIFKSNLPRLVLILFCVVFIGGVRVIFGERALTG